MNVPSGYTALDLIGFTDKETYNSSASYVKNDTGQTKPFLCESEKACRNASVLVAVVQRTDKPEGVSRYSRTIDYEQKIINITAHPIKK